MIKRILQSSCLLAALVLAGCGGSDGNGLFNPGSGSGSKQVEYSGNTVVETGYITVADGTRLRYHMERAEAAPAGPVVMQYDGYDAGTGTYFSNIPDAKAQLIRLGYTMLGVSVRGTGCSSGEFDLFDPQRAIDGAEAVEWAAIQPWSNGVIGMMGYSYPGVMQLFTAGQQPPSLKAIAPSNVIRSLSPLATALTAERQSVCFTLLTRRPRALRSVPSLSNPSVAGVPTQLPLPSFLLATLLRLLIGTTHLLSLSSEMLSQLRCKRATHSCYWGLSVCPIFVSVNR